MLVVALCGVSCLALLFLLLARYGRDVLSGHSVTYVAQHRECHPMLRVHNPFTVAASGNNEGKAVFVRVKATHAAVLAGLPPSPRPCAWHLCCAGGVELCVRSECECQLRLYWGLSYAALVGWPRLPWPRLRDECQAGSLWEAQCLHQGALVSLEAGKEWRWRGQCPVAERPQVLLAVLLLQQDEPAPAQVVMVAGSEGGGTRLLAQHVKLPSGESWPLRQLYAPLGSTCVVCQSREATLTLLPCRHACLCDQCFTRSGSTTCPMCRSHVASCFRVDPRTLEEAATQGSPQQH
ncbi:hypothetical protein HPB48_005667 [Haemaphysalis longicornis]|uniref:RING-type domain-containing protein n=1 Tax=Haemaphysalis longicornis TaxID=44386 RepID=A0A9J6GC60_HAELO|nr:hypothetical protein HPB48_005667 [Haemaphysalis longicornis]